MRFIGIYRRIKLLALALCLVLSVLPASAKKPRARYESLEFVSGLNEDLDLMIHEKSLLLDLAKTQNIRLRIKTKDLYSSTNVKANSFKINMYEIINGERNFVTSQNLTIGNRTRGRIVSIAAGYFASPVKEVEFDIYDTENTLINTYSGTIEAINTDTQVLGGLDLDLTSADCDNSIFNDCQLEYFFDKVTFEAKPQRQISTRVVKGENGLYKVTLPVPREKFRRLGKKDRRKKTTTANGTNKDFSPKDDPATPDTVEFGPADSIEMHYNSLQQSIEFGTNVSKVFSIGLDGKVGIGVLNPSAWLHIRGGDTSTPALRINSGSLVTTPQDGAIEYDGSNLYFTKGAVRSVLGAQGPQGPAGATGATGPQGPAGPAGTFDSSSPITGPITFSGSGRLQGPLTINGDVAFGTTGVLNGTSLINQTIVSGPLRITSGNPQAGRILSTDGVGNTSWIDAAAAPAGDAATLDGLDSTQFLRSDTSDNFSSGVLTTDSGTRFDINGDISIADTSISLDGASTTFAQSTGAITLAPGSNANANITLSGGGDLAVNGNRLFVEGTSGNVGIGTNLPSEKLDIVGNLELSGSIEPGGAAGTAGHLLTSQGAGVAATWTNPTTLNVANADTLDGLQATEFLRSNASDAYTAGTLTLNLGTTLDIDGNINIADTDISLDGASTTLTQSTGDISLAPASGSNVNINLTTNGDFIVNGRALFVESANGNTALGMTSPNARLTVEGAISLDEIAVPDNTAGYGKIYVKATDSKLYFRDDGGTEYDLTSGGGGGGGASNINGLSDAKTDSMSVFLGSNSGANDDGSNANIGVGVSALNANTSGLNNIAIGYMTLDANTTGSNNVAIGRNSLGASTSADTNTAVGSSAMYSNTTGVGNSVLGYAALGKNTTGAYNVALGGDTLEENLTGSWNTAIGYEALNISLANGNTALGYRAGDNINSGQYNLILGYNNDAPVATASNQLDIADTIYGNTSTGNVGIGVNMVTEKLNIEGAIALDEMITPPTQTGGYGKIYVNSADSLLYFIDETGSTYDLTAGAGGGATSINGLSDAKTNTDSVFLGSNAGQFDDATNNKNTALGYESMRSNTTGWGNTATGYQSMELNTSGSSNTAYGYETLYSNTTGISNIAIGYLAMKANTTGGLNTAVGRSALDSNTTGFNNTALGYYALQSNTTGNSNVSLGNNSLYYNTTGNYSIAIGDNALQQSNGRSNIAIGYKAGETISSGQYNIIIGDNNQAGSNTASNQLDIGDLIYGDMSANKYVGINNSSPARNLHISDVMRLEPRAAAPASPAQGDIYIDSSGAMCVYLSGAWQVAAGAGTCI